MFGRLLGKLIATPIRLVNIPVKIVDKLIDPINPYLPLKGRDPLCLEEIAKEVERATDGK